MNNNNQAKNKIEDIILKIQNNELTAKPKAYFRAKFILLALTLFVLFAVSIFTASFIFFAFRAGGHSSLISFGLSGWILFFILFPWGLFVIEILLIVLVEGLLRFFRFGYKIPVLYLLLGVLAVMIITGVILDNTHIHDNFLNRADKNNLCGPCGDFYEGVRISIPDGYGIYRGTVTQKTSSSTLIINLDNKIGQSTTTQIQVFFEDPQLLNETQVGDRVFLDGDFVSGVLNAHGITNSSDIGPLDVDRL